MTGMEHGRFIIVAGSIAMEAAKKLAWRNEGELRKHFPSFIIAPVKNYRDAFAENAAGYEGTDIAASGETEKSRYSGTDISAPGHCRKDRNFSETADFGARFTARRALGTGGVLNGLWYLCENFGAGMEIDILKIPIRQETVEILEYFDVNPYYALSGGAYLLTSDEGELAAEALRGRGITAACIGVLTTGKARIIRYPDHIRYLDRPQKDSLEGLLPL